MDKTTDDSTGSRLADAAPFAGEKLALLPEGTWQSWDTRNSHVPNYGVAQQFRELGESKGI